MLKVRLLGQFDVQRDDTPVEIPSRPAQSLLAYLMLHAGTAQRRERLAGLLWPGSSESNARGNLRHALWRVRKAIGADYILTDRVSVTFGTNADYWLDAAVLDAGAEPGDVLSTQALIERVSLYSGELLPGFYEEWVVWERERLRSVFEDRVELLLERLVEEGRWRQAREWAGRWIAQGQVPEPAYRALMVAHSELGDLAGVAATFQRCVEALEEELGVPPSRETADLYERLSAGERKAPAPVAEERPERKTNLPVPPTPFVGREALLAEISERLAEPGCRLLTLVGAGGSGKTRLALEVAARLGAEAYEHGVYFVSLAPLEAVEAIVPTVAQAVAFTFYSEPGGSAAVEPQRQLLDYLRNKSMLLVMDNFEHLLGPPSVHSAPLRDAAAVPPREGADLLPEILAAAPEVKLLVTSREALNLQGEWFHPVEGMACPLPDVVEGEGPGPALEDFDALALFVQCARRARPGFSFGEEARPVSRICQLVEGTPLAIELAAAWSRVMPLAQIAVELECGLDILTTSLRDVPPRHRSMRAVFDHSWSLLSARERALMQVLSVFRGGFQAAAAAAVAGASLPTLAGLVERSLLRATPEGRYHLHELLRQYAAGKLREEGQEEQLARDQHSEYYAAFLHEQGEALKGHGQQAALAEMEAEIENARAAWNWAVEREQVEKLQQAVDGLCRFYEWRGRYLEGEGACRTAVRKLAADQERAEIISPSRPETFDRLRLWARILAWQSIFDFCLGNTERANQLLGQSLTLLDNPQLVDQDTRSERAFVLLQMGLCQVDSDPPAGKRLYEQSLNLYRRLGDRWEIANVLFFLGEAAWHFASTDEMNRLHEESLTMRETLGDRKGMADSLAALGRNAHLTWQLDESVRLLRESVTLRCVIGDRAGLADGLVISAWILSMLGRFEEARLAAEEALVIQRDLGNREVLAIANGALGWYEMYLGLYRQARPNIERGLTFAREIRNHKRVAELLLALGQVALAEGAWTEAQQFLQESIANSRMLGPYMLCWALASAAYAARGLDNVSQAWQNLAEALQMANERRYTAPQILALPAIALLLADEGQKERAVELYALASRYPFVVNLHWFEDVAGKHIAAIAATLPSEVVPAAQERGRVRDLWSTAAELLAEVVRFPRSNAPTPRRSDVCHSPGAGPPSTAAAPSARPQQGTGRRRSWNDPDDLPNAAPFRVAHEWGAGIRC